MKKIEETAMIATDMMQQFISQNGCPVHMQVMLFSCIVDVIAVMLTGAQKTNITEIQQNVPEVATALSTNLQGELLDRFPFLRFLGLNLFKCLLHISDKKEKLISKWMNQKPC